VIDAAGTVVPIEDARGKPLGIGPGFPYATAARALAPGDCLYLFTDGITEASDAEGRLFEESRLEESLRVSAGAPAREIVDASIARVREFVGDTPQSDDIAAMAIRLVR
jgi:sigma-B regulation protein RsbU (phosphoserine phosphatase)